MKKKSRRQVPGGVALCVRWKGRHQGKAAVREASEASESAVRDCRERESAGLRGGCAVAKASGGPPVPPAETTRKDDGLQDGGVARWREKKDEHPKVFVQVACGGDEGARTPDPHVANVVLSQLSYIPTTSALCARWYFAATGDTCQASQPFRDNHFMDERWYAGVLPHALGHVAEQPAQVAGAARAVECGDRQGHGIRSGEGSGAAGKPSTERNPRWLGIAGAKPRGRRRGSGQLQPRPLRNRGVTVAVKMRGTAPSFAAKRYHD